MCRFNKMFLVMAIAVMAVPATSWGETREVAVRCPSGTVFTAFVECTRPEEWVNVFATCAGVPYIGMYQCVEQKAEKSAPPSVATSPIQAGLGLLGGATLFGKRDVGGFGGLDLNLWVRLKDEWGLLFVGDLGAGNGPGTREAAFSWAAGLGPSYKGGWGRVSLLAFGLGARGLGNESLYEGITGSARVDVLLLRDGQGGLALMLAAYGGPAWREGQLCSVFGGTLGLGWLF